MHVDQKAGFELRSGKQDREKEWLSFIFLGAGFVEPRAARIYRRLRTETGTRTDTHRARLRAHAQPTGFTRKFGDMRFPVVQWGVLWSTMLTHTHAPTFALQFGVSSVSPELPCLPAARGARGFLTTTVFPQIPPPLSPQ